MNKKHEILIGPYRSGKSWLLIERALEHCLNIVQSSKENISFTNETIVIVPSQRYRKLVEQRIKQLINEKNANIKSDVSNDAPGNKPNLSNNLSNNQFNQPPKITGLWGLKIFTFYQFCQATLLKSGNFIKPLPSAIRSPLLAAVCQQLIEEKKISKLEPIVHSTGTQASILSLIDEWQRSAYKAEDVIKKIQKAESVEINQKELAEIFLAYQKALNELNYSDQHGSVLQLSTFLSAGKVQSLSNFIVIDGFDRFDYMQIDFFKKLAEHVEQLYISFDYEKPQNNLFEEYAWKKRSHDYMRQHLSEHFVFKEIKQENKNKKPAIEVAFASDRLAEMAMVAAKVKSAIILAGLKPNEIIVTVRNLNTYKSAIEAAFKDAGLDYYIDQPINIATQPLIRLLLSLLSLSTEDFKTQASN